MLFRACRGNLPGLGWAYLNVLFFFLASPTSLARVCNAKVLQNLMPSPRRTGLLPLPKGSQFHPDFYLSLAFTHFSVFIKIPVKDFLQNGFEIGLRIFMVEVG